MPQTNGHFPSVFDPSPDDHLTCAASGAVTRDTREASGQLSRKKLGSFWGRVRDDIWRWGNILENMGKNGNI